MLTSKIIIKLITIETKFSLALIQKWCGMEKLPWFNSTDTMDIRNSGGYYCFVSFCLI